MSDFNPGDQSRRNFLRVLSTTGAFSLMPISFSGVQARESLEAVKHSDFPLKLTELPKRKELDLSPASWIWFPAERILPNSFFHFRKVFRLERPILSAKGWIQAEKYGVLICCLFDKGDVSLIGLK
ncbi:MAG: hypothetical protein ACXIUQ_14760 [Cecembia sp.]